MTDEMDVPVEDFGRPGVAGQAVTALLRNCLASRAALQVELGSSSVRFAKAEAPDGVILFEGVWRRPELRLRATPAAGEALFAPVLLDPVGLRLPPEALRTLLMAKRSLAGLLGRNLLMALGAGVPLRCTARPETVAGPASAELRRHYLYVLRAAVPETAIDGLGTEAALDRLAAACERPDTLSSPLLRDGARAVAHHAPAVS